MQVACNKSRYMCFKNGYAGVKLMNDQWLGDNREIAFVYFALATRDYVRLRQSHAMGSLSDGVAGAR